jgi:hypothetical protein
LTFPSLPSNLFESQTHCPTQKSIEPNKDRVEFENTPLKEYVDWLDGTQQCLSPNVASELGLDLWLYHLRGVPNPSPDQEDALKKRILELAHQSPLKLFSAIQTKHLNEILGDGFEWVQAPREW